MDAVLVSIVGAIEAIGCAVIGYLVQDSKKKAEEYRAQRDAREEKAAEEARRRDRSQKAFQACQLDLEFAVANACEVLLHKAHGDEVNGNVDAALSQVQNAKSACNHMVNERASDD